MAHDPPPELLDDLESLYPGLESGSSSISSTQENSPLVGPVSTSDFSIDTANLLLERFQLQFMDSLYLDPTGNVTAPPTQEPSNASELFTTPTSAGLSIASAPSIDPTSQFFRHQPGSDLISNLSLNPTNQQQPPSESTQSTTTTTHKQKQKQKRKKASTGTTASQVQPPPPAATPSSLFPPPAPPALGYSRYYRSRHAEPEHDLFFDTDTILNRSGEEETFLRGHPPRFSQMAGGPDVSHRTNYATYYTSQDTFALANVYHAEEEDMASSSEDEDDLASAIASGSGSSSGNAAARGRRLPSLQAVVGGASGASLGGGSSCTRAVPSASVPMIMMPSGTEVGAPPAPIGHDTNNNNNNSHENSIFQEQPLPALMPSAGKGKHKKKAGVQCHRPSIQHITSLPHHHHTNSSPLFNHHQHNNINNNPDTQLPPSSSPSSQDTCIFPPIQSQTEQAFALFPPIQADQFDPRYAIPLLPDSAPKLGAPAAAPPPVLRAPVAAAGLDEGGASDLVGEFLVGFKTGLVIGGSSHDHV